MRSIIIVTDESSALKCMFAPPFLISPFWKSRHPPQERMLLYEIQFRSMLCQFIQFSFWVFWILFKVASLFRSWTTVHGVSRLELPESCRNCALPPFGSFEETGISFFTPIARTRWGQVSGVKFRPSSPWLCRIHSSISSTISFVFGTRKYAEYELDLFSINYPSRFSVLLEIIIPSSGEVDFWLVHRLFSHT